MRSLSHDHSQWLLHNLSTLLTHKLTLSPYYSTSANAKTNRKRRRVCNGIGMRRARQRESSPTRIGKSVEALLPLSSLPLSHSHTSNRSDDIHHGSCCLTPNRKVLHDRHCRNLAECRSSVNRMPKASACRGALDANPKLSWSRWQSLSQLTRYW